jgi:ABC-type nitrate/sulfonate/bicarbonate transport system substrate-binding protein
MRRRGAARTLAACAAFAVLCMAGPARAGDAFVLIGGSNPGTFFEVLDDVALYAGLFKEQGLDVQVRYKTTVPGAANAFDTAQLGASAGDATTTMLEPVILGRTPGLVAFMNRDPQFENVLAVLDDSPIRTPADFKGAKIGELTAGGPGEVLAGTLEGAGLRRSDFTFVTTGFGAAAVTALTTKKVDAFDAPYVELASYEVTAHLKFRYFWDPMLFDVTNATYAATPATIAARGDQLRRFARAMVMAAIVTRVNPELAVRCFMKGAGIPITPESIQTELQIFAKIQGALPGIDPLSKRIGYISPRGVDVYSNYLYSRGITTKVIPASVLVTNQFIDYANDFDHAAFIAHAKGMH